MTPQLALDHPSSLGVGAYEGSSQTKPDSQDITQAKRDETNKFLDPFSIDTSGSTVTPQQWAQAAQDLTSSLYRLHPETTAKYLIETDPAFTNKHAFLSSDYLYEQMKWDPERVPKRLGDGFYEQGLIRDQILNQTGRRYLGDYSDDMAEYKALMDAGVAYARDMGLAPGVTLTKKQAAALTSDMVWLETKTVVIDGTPQDVIYPRVYLHAGSDMTLDAKGSLISANHLVVDTKEAVKNSGILQGKTVAIQAGNMENMGRVQGNTIALSSDTDIHQGGRITATDAIQLKAKNDITMDNTVQHLANQDVLDRTAGIAVSGNQGVVILDAGHNANLAGATIQALGEKGAVVVQAGSDVHLTTQTLAAKKDMTQNSDNYLRTQRQTEVGTAIDAKGGVTMQAGHDIQSRAAYVNSDDGTVALKAGNNIELTTGRTNAVDDYGLKHKESGLLSSTTTTIKTHEDHQQVLGTTITGKTVQLGANQDVNLTAATVAAQDDVTLAAGRNITTTSDTQYDQSQADTKVKTSGIMGAGMGIMIGTKKVKDTYDGEWKTQVGTTIASTGGNVNISAGDTAHLTTTDVVGQKGITVTAQDIILDGNRNEVREKQTHEESQSGLTVSLGGNVATTLETVRNTIRQGHSRDNKTLQALEYYEAGKELRNGKSSLDAAKIAYGGSLTVPQQNAVRDQLVNIHVSLGSSSYKQEAATNRLTYAGGSLSSDGAITLTATTKDTNKGNINAIGEQIIGKDVALHADNSIFLQGAENKQTETTDYSSKGWSVGASFGPAQGGFMSVDASASQSKDKGTDILTTHTPTQIIGTNSVTISTGKDLSLVGAQVSGNTVTADVGGDLHIESQQDTHTYHSKGSSSGFGITAPIGAGTISGSASASKNSMDSDYASVTDQSGIFAGTGGFQIHVEDNTHLKGAVIDSTARADKNSLTTGTLTMEDIQNQADYDSKNAGISYTHYGSDADKKEHYNQTGLTPNLTPGAEGSASTTTHAAIAQGNITTTKEQTDLSKINRDTANALNQLGELFDRKTVEEKQKLSKLFGQEAFKAVGDYAASRQKNAKTLEEWEAWEDGGKNKVLLHQLVGGLMGAISGGSYQSGALSAGLNEAMQGLMKDIKDPAAHQWASAIIGAAANAVTGGNAWTGAAIAVNGTQNNYLTHQQYDTMQAQLKAAKTEEAKQQIWTYWKKIDQENEKKLDAAIGEVYNKYFQSPADYFDPTKYIPVQEETHKIFYDIGPIIDMNGEYSIRVTAPKFVQGDSIDDFWEFKTRKDNNAAIAVLARRGILPTDANYNDELIKEYLKQKEMSDSVWGFALGEGIGTGIAGVAGKLTVVASKIGSLKTVNLILNKVYNVSVDLKKFNYKKTNPLEGVEYSSKVERQSALSDYHGFPDIVDNFGSLGTVKPLVGRDKIVRTLIEIPGSYKGKNGVFQYIIEPDGRTCNHRLFVPK
jgi:filamentous hemagglutinin